MKEEISFSNETQKVYLEFFLIDPDMFALCRNILKPDYFDDTLRPAARFIIEYADQYSKLPLLEQVKAKTNISLEKLPEEIKEHSGWFIQDIEKFCRAKALEKAVFSGPELIKQNRGGELETLIKDAMAISLITDLGSSYFDIDAYERLVRMRDKSGLYTTGWKSLDEKLYGGFSRSSLNIFCGGPGSGKSLFLQNLALNWSLMGLNVCYFSLELPEDFVAFRFDAMLSGKTTREVMHDIPQVSKIILDEKSKNVGDLIIKKFPESGTTVNSLRAFIKEYEIKTKKKFDVIIVDYLDLMHPSSAKIDMNSLFVKDKFTSEELRALMFEFNVYGVSASQINRDGFNLQEYNQSHIAGGVSKLNTADNVLAIYAPDALKNNNEVELQFLKCRTSSAVGQRLRLQYDNDCMRIKDKSDAIIEKKIPVKSESIVEATSKSSVADLMLKLRSNQS